MLLPLLRHRGGIATEAKPLTQEHPALVRAARPQFLASVAPPVTHEALLVPEAEVADWAAVALLFPVGLLVPDQLREGDEGLATMAAAVGLLCEVGLLVAREAGSLAERQGTMGAGEHIKSGGRH